MRCMPASSAPRRAAAALSASAWEHSKTSAARAAIRDTGTPAVSQWAGGGGARTSRLPLLFMALTTPAASMASIIRAARL